MDSGMESVVYSSKIQSVITKRYPNITKLINYNAEGTMAFLQAKHIISVRKGTFTANVEQSGNDNYKTWSDYERAIIEFLERINDDVKLEKARQKLAKKVYGLHFEKFPRWPYWGTQSHTLHLDITDIDDCGEYIVAWACQGEITFKDERRSDYLFWSKYTASFHGKPVLKILMINDRKMRELEYDARDNFDLAKRQVDSETRRLTWETL